MLDATVLENLIIVELINTFDGAFDPTSDTVRKYPAAIAKAIVNHIKTATVTVTVTDPISGPLTGIGTIS